MWIKFTYAPYSFPVCSVYFAIEERLIPNWNPNQTNAILSCQQSPLRLLPSQVNCWLDSLREVVKKRVVSVGFVEASLSPIKKCS